MAQITQLNNSLIRAAVESVRVSRALDKNSTAFIHLMLDAIYPTKEQENTELITDGSNDFGVDAIFIKEHDDHVQVDILSFKYRENENGQNKNFEGNETVKIRRFMDEIHAQNEDVIAHANLAIQAHCKTIWNFFKRGIMCNFRIIFVSNGLGLAAAERDQFSHYCKSHDYLDFEEIEFQSVIRLIAGPKRIGEVAKLSTVDYQIFDRSDGDVRGIIANVDALSLIEAIKDDATNNIKRHLFNDNIRIYLGDDGGYNKQIISSATSEDSYLFWYLNNGITIVCEKASYQKKSEVLQLQLRIFK